MNVPVQPHVIYQTRQLNICRRERSADQSFIAHMNLRSSGRMYPAENQTMQLQARAKLMSLAWTRNSADSEFEDPHTTDTTCSLGPKLNET